MVYYSLLGSEEVCFVLGFSGGKRVNIQKDRWSETLTGVMQYNFFSENQGKTSIVRFLFLWMEL